MAVVGLGWLVIATAGDFIIGIQLILWAFLVDKKKHKQESDKESNLESVQDLTLRSELISDTV